MPHLSVKSTSQDCVCWFLWFLLRRPKHSSPLPFLNFLSTASSMRIKRSHVVSFLSFVTLRCQTDVLADTWWTKSKIWNADNLNMRWEIWFSYKESKQMGGGEPAWRATSPPMICVLAWPEMIPEASPTVHDAKHQTLSEAADFLQHLHIETISSRVDFRVDCCDLSEKIWPDHKLVCALTVNFNTLLGRISFQPRCSAVSRIFQSMNHFKHSQKVSKSQTKFLFALLRGKFTYMLCIFRFLPASRTCVPLHFQGLILKTPI